MVADAVDCLGAFYAAAVGGARTAVVFEAGPNQFAALAGDL
ncbi:hypothetical protein [Haloarcula rubra]|nr:hypothetical protein [Halomicroarcula rubra]